MAFHEEDIPDSEECLKVSGNPGLKEGPYLHRETISEQAEEPTERETGEVYA